VRVRVRVRVRVCVARDLNTLHVSFRPGRRAGGGSAVEAQAQAGAMAYSASMATRPAFPHEAYTSAGALPAPRSVDEVVFSPRPSLERPASSFASTVQLLQGQGPVRGIGGGPSVPSEYNLSDVGASNTHLARNQAGLERRLAWMEEDVALLHRRLRDECEKSSARGGMGGGHSPEFDDGGLRELVARLDHQLEEQLRSLEARLGAVEETILIERRDREAQILGFSEEIDATMRALIGRIDEGLNAGVLAEARGHGEGAELRLRTLMRRVDEELSVGAAMLQDTLSAANGALDMPEMTRVPSPVHSATASAQGWQYDYGQGQSPTQYSQGQAQHGGYMQQEVSYPQEQYSRQGSFIPEYEPVPCQAGSSSIPGCNTEEADQLIKSWDRLRQENILLRERQAQQLQPGRAYAAQSVPGGAATAMQAGYPKAAVPVQVVRRMQGSIVVPSGAARAFSYVGSPSSTVRPTFVTPAPRPAGQ